MSSRVSAGILVAAALCACGHRRVTIAYPDAPLELAQTADRDAATDALDAMAPGPARDAARAAIADALAARIDEALTAAPDAGGPAVAAALLTELAALWQPDPDAIGGGLGRHAAVIRRARGVFARAGASAPAVLALALLAEVEPARRAEAAAEIDEILAFADEQAVAEAGADAARAQPIALLQAAVWAVPLRPLVDRYVGLLAERQRLLRAVLARGAPPARVIHAHRDVLATSRRIAAALARAGRASEIHAHLAGLDGIGIDHDVATRAEIVAEQPSAEAYVALASVVRDAAHDDDPAAAADATAALATCVAGLTRFPRAPALLAAAADHARAAGRVDEAIALLRAGPVSDVEAGWLGELYAERIARLAGAGRPRAAAAAFQELTLVASPRAAGWPDALAHAEAALGRGLVAAGDLAGGERALSTSLARVPTADAYETRAIVELQTGQYAPATHAVASGLALLSDAPRDRPRRARLQRLAGDAFRRAGRAHDAAEIYLDALRTWASLGDARALPRAVAAERMLESGRILWWMADHERGVELVVRAVDIDDNSRSTALTAAAFLLEVDQPAEATEAVHRALASAQIDEVDKVTLALWLVGDGRRRGAPSDRLASEYLASRRGDVWSARLAQAASGRGDAPALWAAATTAPRRAELAFFAATLGLAAPPGARPTSPRALLEQVLDARLVLGAEYDLARSYLGRP